MRGPLKAFFVGLALLAVFVGIFVFWLVKRQGIEEGYWKSFELAKVEFDENHIPTIEAPDWERLVTAQGFVVASDRLWQMDLIRRKAGGRLAEWFGKKAFDHDKRAQLEDRIEVSRKAYAALPDDEKRYCEAYAKGVNRFIEDFPNRWGIEYLLLRQTPEPWTCADSLLIVLEMSQVLTESADTEAQQFAWKSQLSQAWQDFLFPADHPWNKPLFGDAKPLALPPETEALEKRPIDDRELKQEARVEYRDPVPIGSNNWAWSGKTGNFLANDPHLGYGVPTIWYAVRLRVTKDDWAVGASIPGTPAIVLGMNPTLSWAFTNTGEDVDDYLEEKLSADGRNYLVSNEGGREVWQPIIYKDFMIKVAGEDQPRKVEGPFTHRGPIARRPFLGKSYYSRQWLPLKDGMLRMPSVQIATAKSVPELMKGLDSMRVPAQNVLYMDNTGKLGYRVAGTGVVRKQSGLVPRPALEGEWLGFEPAEQRRRLEISESAPRPQHLETANQRIWVDEFGHHWYSDDRFDRIRTFLGSRDDFTRQDMEALHMDTQARFRKLLLSWVATHAGDQTGKAAELVQAWQAWDGSSRSDARSITHSGLVEDELVKLLVGRVQKAFIRQVAEDTDVTLTSETTGSEVKSSDAESVPYTSDLRRAWMVTVLEAQDGKGMAVFGLEDRDVASYLLKRALAADEDLVLHPKANKWRGQHPFVGRIPLIGDAFRVKESEQWGAYDLVLAEQPNFGPSMRIVWDMSRPWESSWIFPVGQSGHVGANHYGDLQKRWASGQRLPVFPSTSGWSFAGKEAPSH